MNEEQTPKRSESTEARLTRLEESRIESDKLLTRLSSLIDGNIPYRIVGLPDQLARYIESDQNWKKATEKRILELEEEKDEKRIVIKPSTAVMSVIIGVLFLVIIWLASHYLQTAGVKGSIAPIMPFVFKIAPNLVRGLLWKY